MSLVMKAIESALDELDAEIERKLSIERQRANVQDALAIATYCLDSLEAERPIERIRAYTEHMHEGVTG